MLCIYFYTICIHYHNHNTPKILQILTSDNKNKQKYLNGDVIKIIQIIILNTYNMSQNDKRITKIYHLNYIVLKIQSDRSGM